jgi:hypothetical protein
MPDELGGLESDRQILRTPRPHGSIMGKAAGAAGPSPQQARVQAGELEEWLRRHESGGQLRKDSQQPGLAAPILSATRVRWPIALWIGLAAVISAAVGISAALMVSKVDGLAPIASIAPRRSPPETTTWNCGGILLHSPTIFTSTRFLRRPSNSP